ncbi:MAG: neutral/alkaline non-lysosomal ceramidase N-terminal domain-containing protein [Chitinophagales bacterium]|nr:neutral/alkaline non-lysosomal ceramidase N-terminal domain-containing protein [Chitinophagales bacterium]
MKYLIIAINFFIYPLLSSGQAMENKGQAGWKAGVASANITPTEPIWMGGFAFRDKPSEGITTDIWAKVLALEDRNQRRAVFIAIETSGVTKQIYDTLLKRLKAAYNLSNDQIVINSSHTHTGPAPNFRFIKDEKEKEKVEKYILKLENQVIEATGKALNSLQPVKLYAGNGVTRFQVNRRTNIEYKLHLQSKFNGPNDYAVPVIKVEKSSGELLAILFGYACHASVLRDYNISGDYPAFAQMELENLYPGATAIFFQGTGGNQVGHPRSSVGAAKQHGKTLAAAVERVLSEPMKSLPPFLTTSYSEINLESDNIPPAKEKLIKIIADTISNSDSTRNKAQAELDKLNRGESLIATYPYPVQVWKIGDLPVITLGGEPVVEYALKLKQIFGQDAFVFGYSNYVMAYISTPLILNEGGYEGSSSPFRGAKWALNTEEMIIQEVLKLAKQVKVDFAPKVFAIPGG